MVEAVFKVNKYKGEEDMGKSEKLPAKTDISFPFSYSYLQMSVTRPLSFTTTKLSTTLCRGKSQWAKSASSIMGARLNLLR